MKTTIMKRKNILRPCLIYGGFFAAGFCLHMLLSPNQTAMPMSGGEASVSVQKLTEQDLRDKKKFIASVEAINSVNIVPQVSGYLEEVRFKDGAFVNEGDVLFIIEQSKFKANVDMAEADLEKAKSLLARSNMTIAEIAEKCGYKTEFHFMRQFKQKTSLTPTEFRNGDSWMQSYKSK